MRRSFLLLSSLLVACGGGSSETVVAANDSSPAIDSSTVLDTDVVLDSSAESSDDAAADSTADTFVAPDTSTDAATDAPPPWPSCDAQPTGTTASTLEAIWAADPKTPAFDWVSGSVVTAVSQGGCSAGKACQIFLQEGAAADLASAKHHAIKLFVSAKAADRFTGIAPGAKVDVAAYAVRYTLDGQNELLLEVNDLLRGCIKATGTGTVTPVAATLDDLNTVSAYESTIGPVLVKVANVSGKPDTPSSIFGLYPTTGFDGGTMTSIVSLSPYFLTGGAFTGLTSGTKTDFSAVTGVFGLFYPGSGSGTDAGAATKYLVIYPRTMTEVEKK